MGWVRVRGMRGSGLVAAGRLRRIVAGLLAPVLAASMSLVPAAVAVTSGAAAVTAVTAAVAPTPARATASTALILSTSVNGGTSSPEYAAAVAAGDTVTVDTPTQWDALSTAQFKAYSVIIIGDPSSGATCSSAAPADAVSTAATWGAAVGGNVAVLGTAPALAGSAGKPLMSDGISYASSGSGTGLYVSLNCEYASSTGSPVPLLAGVDGGGFTVTGHGSACPDAGRVNTWEADALPAFNGLAGTFWAAPACSVEETFTAWPAALGGVVFLNGASPADFTASDGSTGQPFVLAGAAPSAATQAQAPSTGGDVPAGTTAGGGGNAAAPGAAHASAGDPVDTEDGDFTQSDTDLSIPTFGPGLDFTRTYDAQAAAQQAQTKAPGPLGYGWTDNWASSLTAASPAPGDIYSLDGLATPSGNGSPSGTAPLDYPDTAVLNGGNVYIVDTAGNRVEEVPGASGTQWGISMTAGDVYTIAGSPTGAYGDSPNGTPSEAAGGGSLLDRPGGLVFDSSGDLYIADSANNRVLEIPVTTGTHRGVSMTADDVYTIAGNWGGSAGHSGDGSAATSAFLDDPVGLVTGNGTSDIYIADAGNNRVQEVAAAAGTQWGTISMSANDIYTVAGSSAGSAGSTGDAGAATSALLVSPEGLGVSSAGDLYVADTGNNRIQEVAAAAGAQWGITPAFTADDIYTVAGSATGTAGHSGDGGKATSALLDAPASVECDNGTQLYIADSGNNRIQEVARTAHTEWGTSMAINDMYTIAGSSAGTGGFSGDGGAAGSALLSDPGQVAISVSAGLWIADTGNNRVRAVSATTDDISEFAGDGQTLASSGDGAPAVDGELFRPAGEAEDAAGNVYIADGGNNRIQEIPATSHTQWGITMTAGDVYTVAGSKYGMPGSSGDGGAATSALLNQPYGIAADAAGNLYVADQGNNRVRKVAAATGTISTIAGSAAGTSGDTGDNGGPATSALLSQPQDVTADSHGDVYIADKGNDQVEEIFAAGGQAFGHTMTAGDIYLLAGTAGSTGPGSDNIIATSGQLDLPQGVATDAAGNLYIADTFNNRIQEIPVTTGLQRGQQMTADDIYTVAGSATGVLGSSGDGGPATSALLQQPVGLAADATGDLFIADGQNDRVQEVPAASGTQWSKLMTANNMYTVAGNGTKGETGDGGPAASAEMSFAIGVSVDSAGNLYVTDWAGNHVREVPSDTTPTITPAPGLTSALYPAPGGITVTQPGGAQVTFYSQTGGTCTTPYQAAGQYCILPQDEGASLTAHGTTSYTFTPAPGGTTYTYAWDGALTAETDTAGDTLTVTYGTPAPGSGNCPSSAATCEKVTSASGRALIIGSNSSGLVTSVTDPMGRAWTYGYNSASQLTSAADPMSNKTTYAYGAGSTGNPLLLNDLLTITGPNAQPGGPDAGKDTVNIYNAAGQVTTQTDPTGYTTTFNYCVSAKDGDCLNAATGSGYVTAIDPDGDTTIYNYDQGTLAGQADHTGTTLTSEQDSVPDTASGTLLDTASFDGNQNETTSQYNNDGNPTQVKAPDAAGTEATTYQGYTTTLQNASCSSDAEATSGSCPTGPTTVSPGGVITPPSSAPPLGITWTLYDTDGNQLYTTTGVYQPGATTASYQQTTYQLFKNNSITLSGTNITCTTTPPTQSLPCATINADGVVTQLAYNSDGDLTSSATRDGNGTQVATTTYAYDGDGEQTSTVSPDGNLSGANAGNYTTTTAYNSDGQKTSVTQGNGTGYTDTPRAASYSYDGNGNQTTVQDARGYTTTSTYNADDEDTLDTDQDGNATLTCYDGDGNKTETVPPVGVAANSLTPAGCPSSYPSGYGDRLASDSTTYTFDAAGDTTAETYPAPAGQTGSESMTFTYDGDGDVLNTTVPPAVNGGSDQVTVDTYNTDGDLAAETTGYGTSAASTVSFCYDPDGDQASVVYADGNTGGTAPCETSSPWVVNSSSHPTQAGYQTISSYDSAGELVSATTPATTAAPHGATTSYTYDADGNQLTTTDPHGVTTTRTYTPQDQVASISYSASSAHSVSYTYDADGNETATTDGTGSPSYSYDPFGELTSETNGAGATTGYSFDADGDVTGITYPLPSGEAWSSTDTVDYGYDHADQMTSATDFNGKEISITRNANELRTSVSLGSTGDTIATTYDNTASPSEIALDSGSTTLQSFTYSDAPSAAVVSETDTPSSSKSPAVYTYDAKSRVISMTPGTGSTLNYGFDASGNLTTLPPGAAGTYDKAGELASSVLSGTTTSYTYNADGQRLNATQGSITLASATWNGAEEPTSYSDSAAEMTAASYDGNGLRASAATGGTTEDFTWDTQTGNAQAANPGGPSQGGLPQLLMDSGNAYIYTSGAAPAEQVNLSTGAITYLVADTLGSVRGTVSSSGTLTGTTSYNAWGDPGTSGGLTATTRFGYAGGYTDPTGLIYSINRYYDPGTGQFISVDPDLIQTQTAYAYAGDNPITGTDPTGLVVKADKCEDGGAIGPDTLKVKFCAISNKTITGFRWQGEVTATLVYGAPLTEMGAARIWLRICGSHDTNCHPSHGVSHPRGHGAHPSIRTHVFDTVCSGYISVYVAGVWAKSTNGQLTKPISFHNNKRDTCHHILAQPSGDGPDLVCTPC
jgi:RHS repeat-associated protein